MRFHVDGYVAGDPRIEPAAGSGLTRPAEIPEELDALIVGAGPAGLILAAQLSQFPNVTARLIDRREGPLITGQADGVQARTVETFQAFGFANRIVEEAYHITQMAFWRPDPNDPRRIARAAMLPDDPHGLSEFPHIIVNQARVQDYFLEFMENSPTRMRADYGVEFRGLRVTTHAEYPVEVQLRHRNGPLEGLEQTVRAKYVVGCDGARSAVREAIGRRLVGDQAMHAWGVVDVLGDSDFPDIRTKSAIQSHDGGSILHIPREGGHLFRLYVDLGDIAADTVGAVRKTSVDQIISRANEIFFPYSVSIKSVVWHSVYEVAHRLTDRFDDLPDDLPDADADADSTTPRVFIAGDACHTHSAKAAQGMNVSMQDGFNLGWKLGHVLDGRSPSSLLQTYSAERQAVARDLIEFDKGWSSLMAARPAELENPAEVEEFFLRTFDFTTGFMTQYQASVLTSETHQSLAAGYPIGKRFKSERVLRVCDGNPVHLGHEARADGRWRLYVFADATQPAGGGELDKLADWLAASPHSPLQTCGSVDPFTHFDVKVVYQEPPAEHEIASIPSVFLPRVGSLRLISYENVFAIDPESNIFETRSIDRDGAVVVVRPDQYVSTVLPLTGTDELAAFFAALSGKVTAS